jgi:uncharacterized protein YciI
MLYAIMGRDSEDSLPRRKSVREQHLSRIKDLQAAGRLLLAGPHPRIDSPAPGEAGFSGSLIIAEFDSLEAARQWASEDPYSTGGVFEEVVVKPFVQTLP